MENFRAGQCVNEVALSLPVRIEKSIFEVRFHLDNPLLALRVRSGRELELDRGLEVSFPTPLSQGVGRWL